MSHAGRLYGLPMSLDLMVLYDDPEIVDQPARFVDDLLAEADPDHRVGISIGFEECMWGVSAFGGASPLADQRLVLVEDGFVSWLEWLLAARDVPGVLLSTEHDWLLSQFLSGRTAYLVGRASLLRRLEQELDPTRLGVLRLPLGPSNETRPYVRVDGLMVNASSPEERSQLALALARRLTDMESQTLLMTQGARIPTNINVATDVRPNLAAILEQAKTVTVPLNDPSRDALWAKGDGVYFQSMIASAEGLSELVQPFVRAYNEGPALASSDSGRP